MKISEVVLLFDYWHQGSCRRRDFRRDLIVWAVGFEDLILSIPGSFRL